MKRILTLCLALAILLTLCACGGSSNTGSNETLDKSDTANYLCTWETEHYRLTISKGGVGRYENSDSTESYDLNWEVTDDVLVTQISFFGMEFKAVMELSEDGSSLTALQLGFPVYVEGEDTFTKQ